MELRKNLLTAPRLRDALSRAKAAKIGENATTMAPWDLPPPKQGCCSAGGGLVAYAKALCQMSKCVSWKKKWIRMVAWCLGLDGRRDRDECAKPTVGRAHNLSNGIVAVFFMVRLQEAEMRKALHGDNRSGGRVRGIMMRTKSKPKS